MYGSMGQLTTMYIGLLFSGFSNVYHFACVWPTALKPDCVTNFDMLFLVMGFISLVDEIQFMLISSRHICMKSMQLLRSSWLLRIFFSRPSGSLSEHTNKTLFCPKAFTCCYIFRATTS